MDLESFAALVDRKIERSAEAPVPFNLRDGVARWTHGSRSIYIRKIRGVGILSGACDAIELALVPERATHAACLIGRMLDVKACGEFLKRRAS